MSRFGLYIKTQQESRQHINIVDMPSVMQAEAYFAGIKKLTLEEFRKLFVVKEVQNYDKKLIYGNR